MYSVSLRRQRSQRLSPAEGTAGSQAPSPIANTFLHYRTSKVRVLRAARLERLVGELVSGDHEQDPSFVPAFLATYRTFVPTAHLLGFLLPPMPPPPPPGSVVNQNLHVPHPRPPVGHPPPPPQVWNQETPPKPRALFLSPL